jgi:hypothetical protein
VKHQALAGVLPAGDGRCSQRPAAHLGNACSGVIVEDQMQGQRARHRLVELPEERQPRAPATKPRASISSSKPPRRLHSHSPCSSSRARSSARRAGCRARSAARWRSMVVQSEQSGAGRSSRGHASAFMGSRHECPANRSGAGRARRFSAAARRFSASLQLLPARTTVDTRGESFRRAGARRGSKSRPSVVSERWTRTCADTIIAVSSKL